MPHLPGAALKGLFALREPLFEGLVADFSRAGLSLNDKAATVKCEMTLRKGPPQETVHFHELFAFMAMRLSLTGQQTEPKKHMRTPTGPPEPVSGPDFVGESRSEVIGVSHCEKTKFCC